MQLKKLFIGIALSITMFFTNIKSMEMSEKADLNSLHLALNITNLPEEVLWLILEQVIDQTIKDYFNSFDNLFDVSTRTCEKNFKEIIEDIWNICIYVPKTCQIFRAIFNEYGNRKKRAIEKFRKERFDYLASNIKLKLEEIKLTNTSQVKIDKALFLCLSKIDLSQKENLNYCYYLKEIIDLIFKGANKEIITQFSGNNVLSIFIDHGYIDIFKWLISIGCSIDAKDECKRTLLIRMVQSKRKDMVELILSYKPNLEIKDNMCYTALIWATIKGNSEIVDLLLRHGANVNAVDDLGNITVLMNAVERGHEEIVKSLLSNGANVFTKNEVNETALDIARKFGHTKIAQLIEKHIRKQDNI
ncbi:ankyrin repeat domain-containing protein [Candidatus Babela massiliensis]|uniref:Ankyrin repeats containing protein n=1 Tax=Candidatus Babela massiliensis TaxID=673862 RepID=V6DHG9_9BACT|nr:ankyrin repeat domain-containing protein [Candidatus Babela massiliensis]CDK30994.1 Ankyrin repeats containing protein [Candidatus Babela massiliensis]